MAREVCRDDDQVDLQRKMIRKQILSDVMVAPHEVEHLFWLDAISKHLERLGDLATNIAEDVIYMIEGDIVRHLPTATQSHLGAGDKPVGRASGGAGPVGYKSQADSDVLWHEFAGPRGKYGKNFTARLVTRSG